jgi:low temperature requirement protein LtrA
LRRNSRCRSKLVLAFAGSAWRNDRRSRVSPLELLSDLVYATVIAQAANHLAAYVSAGGLFEFMAVFSLTWIAWANGSLYLELARPT